MTGSSSKRGRPTPSRVGSNTCPRTLTSAGREGCRLMSRRGPSATISGTASIAAPPGSSGSAARRSISRRSAASPARSGRTAPGHGCSPRVTVSRNWPGCTRRETMVGRSPSSSCAWKPWPRWSRRTSPRPARAPSGNASPYIPARAPPSACCCSRRLRPVSTASPESRSAGSSPPTSVRSRCRRTRPRKARPTSAVCRTAQSRRCAATSAATDRLWLRPARPCSLSPTTGRH